MEFMLDSYESRTAKEGEKDDLKYLLLRFLKFRLPNGNNVLHLMATCDEFLSLYKRDVDYLI